MEEVRHILQTLVWGILPPTTAITGYAEGFTETCQLTYSFSLVTVSL